MPNLYTFTTADGIEWRARVIDSRGYGCPIISASPVINGSLSIAVLVQTTSASVIPMAGNFTLIAGNVTLEFEPDQKPTIDQLLADLTSRQLLEAV